MVSAIFLAQKTIGKKNIFSLFRFQEMSLKREVFVNFLPQKFMTKYGIVSTYSITVVSQKILGSLQCNENQFGVATVYQTSMHNCGQWPQIIRIVINAFRMYSAVSPNASYFVTKT